MRKNKIILSLVCILFLMNVKLANAIVFDTTLLAQQIGSTVQKIQTIAQKSMMTVKDIKSGNVFGFSINFDDYLNGLSDPNKKKNSAMMSETVKSTDAQTIENMELKDQQDVASRKSEYDQKIVIEEQKIEIIDSTISKKQEEKKKWEREAEKRKAEYEKVKNNPKLGSQAEAEIQYKNAEIQYKNKEIEIEDLKDKKQKFIENKQNYQDVHDKIGTEADSKHKMASDRIRLLNEKVEETEKNRGFVSKMSENDNKEWTDTNISDFSPTQKDYINFMKLYFYNTEKAKNNKGDSGRIENQTQIDAISRERRYLITNTMSHLMNVSAKIRDTLPKHQKNLDDLYDKTVQTDGALEAATSAAAIKLENTRILLQYARLQCARLQYEAAEELLGLDVVKVYNEEENYNEFNLDRYILTKEEIEARLPKKK